MSEPLTFPSAAPIPQACTTAGLPRVSLLGAVETDFPIRLISVAALAISHSEEDRQH